MSLDASLNGIDISDKKQFLTVTLGSEEFGIEIMSVKEIKAWTVPTRLPNVPEYLLGVVNLRGVIIPVYDLKMRFGIGKSDCNVKNAIVFVSVQNRTIGVLVDSVSDIIAVSDEELKPAPEMYGEIKKEYINSLVSIADKMVVLINIESLFLDDEMPKDQIGTAA